MKKWLMILLTMILGLSLACAAATAESAAADESGGLAEMIYEEYLGRIASTEDEIGYLVGTVEYGMLVPLDVDPKEYLDALGKAKLVAADTAEAPDGEFVVLRFPDQCQFDFFQGEEEKNYVRVTIFGDTDEVILTQAVFPDDSDMSISGLMQMWADDVAAANGIPVEDGEGTVVLPEAGWVRESVDGAVWQDDRASLEVFPEDEGFKVVILWGSSAWECTEWTYACYYDDEGQRLTAVHVACDDVRYDDNGNETRNNVMDQECEAVFSLNEEGKVLVQNAADERLEGKTFEMIPAVRTDGGLHADIQQMTDSPEWVANLPAAKEAKQLFVVAGIGMDKTTAYISMHQKDEEGNWKQILSTPGFVGKNGLCADADHKEGCGQTPVGVYHFNKAFGIAADPGCDLPYIQVDENTYWSGDPDRQYNQMVDIRDVPELVMDDSEHIVDYEYQYQYCLNISFNEEGTPGRGSAIFLHCFGPQKPWTGGCVAVPENIMRLIMLNVQEDCVVVIDTLENLGGSF